MIIDVGILTIIGPILSDISCALMQHKKTSEPKQIAFPRGRKGGAVNLGIFYQISVLSWQDTQ